MRKHGKIIIISGPSGSGKTTIYKKLLQDPSLKKGLEKSISVTTRSPRSGEAQGRDYIFVSHKMFAHKKRAGHFLENMRVFDNYYGTPRKEVKKVLATGKSVLLAIDVKGARVVRKQFPEAITIFVKTPSLSILKKRLAKRGSETKETLALRLQTARKELQEAKHYHHVVVNDSLSKALAKVKKILKTAISDGS